MSKATQLLCLLIVSSTTTGCMWWEEAPEEEVVEGAFDFGRDTPITTWYHFPGTPSERWAVDATDATAMLASNITAEFSGNSTPFFSSATY